VPPPPDHGVEVKIQFSPAPPGLRQQVSDPGERREAPGEGNTTCGEAVGSSHDLIAHLMNVRAAAGQHGVNKKRMGVQVTFFSQNKKKKRANAPCRGP
jgi:hypothetical protein